MSIFNTVLNTTAIMLTLMAVGYLFGRLRLVGERAGRDIAALEVRLFLPAYLFVMLAGNVVPSKIAENAEFLLWGLVFLLAMIPLAFLLSRLAARDKLSRLMLFYILLYPNFGYFGYPVIEAAFGGEALASYIIYVLPLNIAVYTHGSFLLSSAGAKGEKRRFTAQNIRGLPWEVLISVVLGITVGLTEFPLPRFVYDLLNFTAACMSPLSMLLAGFILSALPPGKLFSSLSSYLTNALKLLALPALCGSVLYLAGVRGMFLAFPVIISAFPVGVNIVIFSNPERPDYVSSGVTCFISYIPALISVPAVIWILSLIM